MLDVVVRQLAPLAPTSDTPSSIRVGRGGSGASVALAIALDAHHVTYVGAAGIDPAADMVRDTMERGGVATRFEQCDAATGTVVSMVGADGQRSMLTDRGANSLLSESFVVGELAGPFDHLHLSGYLLLDPSTRAVAASALAYATSRGATTSIDVCSVAPLIDVTPRVFLETATGATYLFANEEEALVLTARENVGDALEFLADRFDEVMITRGREGALVARGEDRYDVRARQVAVLDTTGAGDAATGAYLGARLDARDIESAMERAMAQGARVVGDLGAN